MVSLTDYLSFSTVVVFLFRHHDYFFVIQAGRFETLLTLESRTGAVLVETGACCAVVAAALAGGAFAPLSAAGGAVTPLGFTPYGLGVPTGGDQVP